MSNDDAYGPAFCEDEQLVERGFAVRNRDVKPENLKIRYWERLASQFAERARNDGIVITIEQVSDFPPAMGKHHDVVTVREVRK